MSTSAVVAGTPNYVLMDGNRRIGPEIVQLHAGGIECSAIYGFANKVPFDRFCFNSQRALKPYPLVNTYLRNQLGAAGNGLKLVVVDATGPSEPYLNAATMQAVLDAQEKRSSKVTVAYRLVFDSEVSAYRVEELSADSLAVTSVNANERVVSHD